MVRSIEQILGLPPMNQNDAAALPMSELFSDEPDFTPYDAVPNRIPLDSLNGQTSSAATAVSTFTPAVTPEVIPPQADQSAASTQQIEKLWMDWSDRNIANLSGPNAGPDKVNANMLNHDVWYATKGFDRPYPGEERVLTPDEVAEQPESKAPSPAKN
jgi:hypothetical protein